jgi:cell division protein FtsB
METNQKESAQKKVLIAVIVALLLVVCVSLYFVFSGRMDNTNLSAEKATLDSTFRNLSDTLDVRQAEIDQITAKNVKLDSVVLASQASIDKEKKQISGLLSKAKITSAELSAAKGMMIQYEASISDLQKQIVELCAANQQLTGQNEQLSSDLTSEKQTSSALNAQNLVLAKKVELGSLLQLANVEVAGVKERQNGKEVIVRSAKAAESLRVRFATGENKVLSPGPLSLYVRVINPKGETAFIDNQASGNLQLAGSNSQVAYSNRADIDWQQTGKNVVVYSKKNITTAGIYKVEIYQSGYLIGKGEVKLD